MRILVPSLVLAALAVAAVAVGRSDGDDLKSRYEAATAAGDSESVDALLKERRFEVIYLVDGYLEGWLKQTEAPAAERMERPETLLEAGIAAAAAADRAFGGDAYTRYAVAWKEWSPEQRLEFREGQKKFYAGREAQKEKRYEKAGALYGESLALADPLKDLWGIAQAEQALGDLAIGAGRLEDAVRHHRRARDVFLSLNHPRVLRSLNALGMVQERTGDLAAAERNLEEMLRLAKLVDRETDTTKVEESLARIRNAMGK